MKKLFLVIVCFVVACSQEQNMEVAALDRLAPDFVLFDLEGKK